MCCFFVCCQSPVSGKPVELFPDAFEHGHKLNVGYCCAFPCKLGRSMRDTPIRHSMICTEYTQALIEAFQSSKFLKEALGKISERKHGGQHPGLWHDYVMRNPELWSSSAASSAKTWALRWGIFMVGVLAILIFLHARHGEAIRVQLFNALSLP